MDKNPRQNFFEIFGEEHKAWMNSNHGKMVFAMLAGAKPQQAPDPAAHVMTYNAGKRDGWEQATNFMAQLAIPQRNFEEIDETYPILADDQNRVGPSEKNQPE